MLASSRAELSPAEPSRLNLGVQQLSYAAGSTSLEPDGYRLIGASDGQRLAQLVTVFPSLSSMISPESLIVSAYPAALGLQGFAPLVDTYLHPPTFVRSMRLAARQVRPIVFAAQPLVGADFLVRALRSGYEMPHELLWATGGYYFPQSLERFIAEQLGSIGCRFKVLHCYGVAEIGHTCFAAMKRFKSGLPKYQKIVDHVTVSVSDSGHMTLTTSQREVVTEDHAQRVDECWSIRNGSSRLSNAVLDELESWTTEHWLRRTGYLHSSANKSVFQLREWVDSPTSQNECRYHRFWETHGGSLQSKPVWSQSTLKQLAVSMRPANA